MRFAYADPPYLGQGTKHYGDLHADAGDCDDLLWHKALIERLCDEFPDGWALSLHTPSLKAMLNFCPDDVRVGAWVKPFAAFKKNVTRAYAWEPVILRGGVRSRPASRPCATGSRRPPCPSRSRCGEGFPARSQPPSHAGYSTGSTCSRATNSSICFREAERCSRLTRRGWRARPENIRRYFSR